MFVILSLHAALGSAILLGARRLGSRASLIALGAPVATLGWLITSGRDILDGNAYRAETSWVPALRLNASLRVDAFALVMVGLVAGIGVIVLAYARTYLSKSDDAGRTAGLLVLFAGAMTLLVTADDVLLLYTGWELTSVFSYLLIGGRGTSVEARRAARHALVVTAAGGLAMLGGLVTLGVEAGTFELSELLAHPPTGTATSVALLLVVVGAAGKSAQVPFHRWLPGAMVAPTPVSAYLHSATMVKAGVYLVARFAPTFADHGAFRPVVVGAGLATMLIGGWRALSPTDLKQLLAHSTVSQLGFLFVLFGLGHPAATAAGVAVLVAHALFKATLFLVVGTVDHAAGTRDLARLPDLTGPRWRPTIGIAAVAAASMAAVPPLAGFVAKEAAFASLVDGSSIDRLVLAGLVIGSALTVAYSLRFAVGLARPGALVPERRPIAPAGIPPIGLLLPAVPLAALTLVLGLAPTIWEWISGPAGEALDPAAHPHLVLWAGIGAPLFLSGITLAGGATLYAIRRQVEPLVRSTTPTGGVDGFEWAVAGLFSGARWTARAVQRGSLPFYAGLALTFSAVVPLLTALTGTWWSGGVPLVESAAELPIAALLVAAGIGCTSVRRRYVAAILLGVVGYAMALLFVVHGAPDLALTQFGVETLSVVVFLVVLRFLPDRFERRPAVGARSLRVAGSVAVGLFVLGFSLATAGVGPERRVAAEMLAEATPKGHGSNVVNVILVDIRGLDTLGEITVLVAAAVGVAALARAGTRPRRRGRA